MWLNENISYKFPSKMIKINPRIPSDVNITNFQTTKSFVRCHMVWDNLTAQRVKFTTFQQLQLQLQFVVFEKNSTYFFIPSNIHEKITQF